MSRLARQSFLGPESESILEAATVGLVGLGGGGSHIVQQLNHEGVGGFVLIDPDIIDDTNTNRLIGGTLQDVTDEMPKVSIAERLIRGLQPKARVCPEKCKWQSSVDLLKTCDILIGAVDSFKERCKWQGKSEPLWQTYFEPLKPRRKKVKKNGVGNWF